MQDKLLSFPLEALGMADVRQAGKVIFGVSGWTLTVGDVIEARERKNEMLSKLCRELNMPFDGEDYLLADRIRAKIVELKRMALNPTTC